MENTDVFLLVTGLILDQGLLEVRDLGAMMNVSKDVCSSIRESHSWELYLDRKRLGLAPPYGRICTEGWKGPYIPDDYDVRDLHIPPRPRARGSRQPDRWTYYPHRNDTRAQGHVLVKQPSFYLHRFNPETGALCDLFYPAHEDPGGIRTDVYVQRDLPITCHACGVVCTTYPGLVQHCMTLDHQVASVPPERRLPSYFNDPRNKAGYERKTPFEKVKACVIYKQRVLDFLRAPMDSAGLPNMERHLDWITRDCHGDESLLENCTIERVTKACVDFVVRDFLHSGMEIEGYTRDVIVDGWGRFGPYGSCSSRGLFKLVVYPRFSYME